jgi:ABC-type transport system involved in multi-copper enzyme maturation permease subunit
MYRLRQFVTLVRLTAVEAMRQPICVLLAATGLFLTAITPLVVIYKFGEDGKLARDSGLAFHLVFGLMITAYAAGTSLARELRSGTAAAVLSKPVGRHMLFLAKYTGVAVVTVLYSIGAMGATLLSERVDEKFVYTRTMTGSFMDWQTGALLTAAPFVALLVAGIVSYRTRRAFGSSAFVLLILSVLTVFVVSGFFDRIGNWAPFDYQVDWRLLPAGLLLTLALLVFAAIAAGLSSRFNTVVTLVACVVILMVGLVSDYMLGRYAGGSWLAAGLYRIVPNWQHFWMSDALSGGGHIPWDYVGKAAAYAGLYTGSMLCLGLAVFNRAEVK